MFVFLGEWVGIMFGFFSVLGVFEFLMKVENFFLERGYIENE